MESGDRPIPGATGLDAPKYLVEILATEKTTSAELIKRLLHDHWNNLQSRQTVLERMGGYPKHLLSGPSDLSDRDVRKQHIAEYFQKHHESHQYQDL
jgi:hypothetical protein